MTQARIFAFGAFLLIPERQQLLRENAVVAIGGRAFDLLTALVERPGEVIKKDELISFAWPTTTVDESNLKVNIGLLRRVLSDEASAAKYIATVAGRGYRFIAPVQMRHLSKNDELGHSALRTDTSDAVPRPLGEKAAGVGFVRFVAEAVGSETCVQIFSGRGRDLIVGLDPGGSIEDADRRVGEVAVYLDDFTVLIRQRGGIEIRRNIIAPVATRCGTRG